MRASITIIVLALLQTTCERTWQAKLTPPSQVAKLDREAPFLKCHMRDGRVIVLRDWEYKRDGGEIWGTGYEYDVLHSAHGAFHFHSIPANDVALFETNRPLETPGQEVAGVVVASVLTGASLAATVVCAANPKSCFGSCPTFYADDGSGLALQAEGFSASIARALEATDVDAMWTVRPSSRTLDVLMTNDALETHAVDSVRILAAPRAAGSRVLRTSADEYWAATRLVPGNAAQSDVTRQLAMTDAVEYHSPASNTDLAEKETLRLSFPAATGKRGLLLVARNSLLNTFLFYQALAFMGTHAGELLATLEREDSVLSSGIMQALGDIRVRVRLDVGTWYDAGAFAEVGPIAREAQLVPLPETNGPIEIELVLTKGNWRIDQAAIAQLGQRVTPVALSPRAVVRGDASDPRALDRVQRGGGHLLTYPGDAYTLRFDLPEGDHELFLESRGYYYEWMRREWLAEENLGQAMRLILDPEGALKRLAPKFKRIEDQMEPIFWSSRVARKP